MDKLTTTITNAFPYENTSINNYSYNNFCQYRLPCGYCERLGRDCPKQHDGYDIKYNENVIIKC